MEFSINYLAVLVSGISNMVIGFLWFGPVFGKVWIKLMGWGPEVIEEAKKKGGMGKSYVLALVGAVVTAYVLAHFLQIALVFDVAGALMLVFWLWLGFIATVLLSSVLWEGRSWKLYFFNLAYYLVAFSAMAVILTLWK